MKFMYFFDCKLKRFTMYGKRMLHPSQTGNYQEGISCIKEDDVNLWFYAKGKNTIAIDAGHLVFKGIDIAESGTHEELITKGGKYAMMIKR